MRTPLPLIALSLTALVALVAPASGSAATDVGRVAPQGATLADCLADTGHVTSVATGTNPYIAPVSGVITEWRFRADVNPGTIAMQVLNVVNNSTYTPITESPPTALVAGQLNKVEARVAITAGQIIGLRTVGLSHGCYAIGQSGFTDHGGGPPAPLPGGGPAMYGNGMSDAATNIAVTVEADGDGDGYGDETQDGCPKNANRSDDCVAPSVKIDSGPKKKTKKAKAKFSFSSDDGKASFECSLDGKKFTPCSSPLKVKVKKARKKAKKHTFAVRAVDDNGNKSDEADYKWKVKPKKKRK